MLCGFLQSNGEIDIKPDFNNVSSFFFTIIATSVSSWRKSSVADSKLCLPAKALQVTYPQIRPFICTSISARLVSAHHHQVHGMFNTAQTFSFSLHFIAKILFL